MNKIAVIIFTYKRAILLQNCLETLLKNFKNLNFPIHVIYHYDKAYKKTRAENSSSIFDQIYLEKINLSHIRKAINLNKNF